MAEERPRFATYRGAGHVALVWGVPLMPMLVLCGLLVATLFLFILLLKMVKTGLAIAALVACVMVWMKVECAGHPKALEIRKRELRELFRRLKLKSKTIVVTSMKGRKRKDSDGIQRYIKRRSRIR
ncbi:hypothetical protein [Kushneria indalinina]|uniref:hypothetical protein n=1 Tax=Kushneria indalinina TaxID=184067 RepID=UPI000E285276|nr:hypothetical protein [Kushneria indalinina]